MEICNVSTVVICAAGMGSRLGLDKPKCLVDLGGRKLIYYLLKLLRDVEEVRIVVGFREEEVISYVKSIRPDAVFVRNSDYSNTTNAYSLYLGTHDLKEAYITIDGDMVVDPDSFHDFVEALDANQTEITLGLAKAKTEDAVFVKTSSDGMVEGFSRSPVSDKEWSGIAFIPAKYKISRGGKYVYQELEKYLPLKSHLIECWEIDTPQDMSLVFEEVEFSKF